MNTLIERVLGVSTKCLVVVLALGFAPVGYGLTKVEYCQEICVTDSCTQNICLKDGQCLAECFGLVTVVSPAELAECAALEHYEERRACLQEIIDAIKAQVGN